MQVGTTSRSTSCSSGADTRQPAAATLAVPDRFDAVRGLTCSFPHPRAETRPLGLLLLGPLFPPRRNLSRLARTVPLDRFLRSLVRLGCCFVLSGRPLDLRCAVCQFRLGPRPFVLAPAAAGRSGAGRLGGRQVEPLWPLHRSVDERHGCELLSLCPQCGPASLV